MQIQKDSVDLSSGGHCQVLILNAIIGFLKLKDKPYAGRTNRFIQSSVIYFGFALPMNDVRQILLVFLIRLQYI